MDEYIDIVTASGKPTKKIALKSEAHKKGLWHNTIHLWLYTNQGKILLQQRSRKKTIYPLLWDVSVAGHIDAGESLKKAAIRETYEELGLQLTPKELLKIGIHKHQSTYANGAIQDNEFHHIYMAKLRVKIESLKLQKDEVEAVKLVTTKKLTQLLNTKNNNHFVKSNQEYYNFVWSHILKQL